MATQIEFDDKHKLILIHSRPEEMLATWLEKMSEFFMRNYKGYSVRHIPYGEPIKDDLRDQFAMSALQGILASPLSKSKEPNQYADAAYEVADAMLEARK